MKDCYREHEPHYEGMTKEEIYNAKRQKLLEVIEPICKTFQIDDYDYICNNNQERLIVEGQSIGCRCNSIGATVMELIAYIFCKTYVYERGLGAFEKQTLNKIKRYWIK